MYIAARSKDRRFALARFSDVFLLLVVSVFYSPIRGLEYKTYTTAPPLTTPPQGAWY